MVPFSKFLERMSEEVPKYSFIWSWLPPGETEEGGDMGIIEVSGRGMLRNGYRSDVVNLGDYPVLRVVYRRSILQKCPMKILTE